MDALELELTVPLRSFSLELTLAAGAETLALVGPSGAGKTTLLRTVAGLVRPARGRVVCSGQVWFDGASGVDLRPEERSAGFVFQEYALFPHLSVERNVAFGGRQDGLLERLGIAHLAKARPADLSGGERQRVAIARALIGHPAVILADEPTGSLDSATGASIMELIRELNAAGATIVMITHDAGLADRLPRQIRLLDGQVVSDSATGEAP